MNKGLKNLKKRNEESYYKYIAQNHLDDPEQRSKYETKDKIKNVFGRIFSTIVTIVFISIITYFAYDKILSLHNKTNGIALNTYSNITTPAQNKQKEIVNCLNALKPYIDNISNDIKKRNSDVEQINNKKLSKTDYIKSIQSHDELVKKNIVYISNITVPEELKNYVTQINEGYQLLSDGYESESIYLKTNQQKYKQSADDNYKLSNEKLNNSNTELTKVLDINNIKHK